MKLCIQKNNVLRVAVINGHGTVLIVTIT